MREPVQPPERTVDGAVARPHPVEQVAGVDDHVRSGGDGRLNQPVPRRVNIGLTQVQPRVGFAFGDVAAVGTVSQVGVCAVENLHGGASVPGLLGIPAG